jgi:colanic acid/amylovoran biosynthesis glycosyltransferase
MTGTSMTDPGRCRIAYLISKYPDVSHTFILREVAAMRERGIEIETASINACPPDNKLTRQERDEAARTFYVKQQGVAGVLRAKWWMLLRRPGGFFRGLWFALRLGGADLPRAVRHLFYFAEALILAQWMHERSLRHLHVHFATPAATVALILSKTAPVSISITVHGPDEFYDVTEYALREKLEAARFVVCISFFAQSQLMKLMPGGYWQKFEIARLGVDTSHFAPRSMEGKAGPFTVLCVGRLVSTKGQRILIEAAARLRQEGRALRVQFVGNGPDRTDLERLVSVRSLASVVEFVGSINQEHIQEFYRGADVFALASFAEGIPVVLMEAMAMEIPCVASRINGIPELIEDGENGLLVAPSDVDGLAAAIAKLMDSEELRKRVGEAGRRRVQEQYELSRSADKLAEIFRRRVGYVS